MRLRVQLEVARSDAEPRPVVLTAPGDATTGAALDVIGAHLGLSGVAGAVQARSLISGSWLDRGVRLDSSGLLRGERLSLLVGLQPGGAPRAPTRWPTPRVGDGEGRVSVNRPPRAVRPEPETSIAVPRKRGHRPPRRFPLGAMLIPLGIGALLVAVTQQIQIALFSLFTPVMVAWNYVEERRARSDEIKEYGRSYQEEVDATLGRVRTVTDDWAQWLREHHPAPEEVTEIARTLSPRLWERQPADPDYLHLRVGLATRRAPVTLRGDGGELGGSSQDGPDYASAATVSGVPAVVDLARDGVIALLGSDDQIDRGAAFLAAQLAALHSPAEVLMAGALADQETREWWRWLPHLAHDWLGANPLAADRGSADRLLEAVADFGRERRAAQRERHVVGGPLVVVFVDDRIRSEPSLFAEVAALREVGILTVWLGSDPRAVPPSASSLLTYSSDGAQAELVSHRGGDRLQLAPDYLSRSAVLDLSSALAPARDASDANQIRSIPERVSLEELIPEVASPVALRERWDHAPDNRLTARLGISADGPVDLELGPEGSHALVGGTTGSGKSELLQSMVAAVAAAYPPSRVGFLLVDYKGGAAFKDAMNLPHCVGVVTDLDAHLTRRVMHALDAEIRRREELLAEGGARDLTELRRLAPQTSPGDLVIVVDEFATLAKEIPEFVEGMVDIAARGRSLGLRLVLATQRPAGVINDRIRANVGVRIALRVNDEADSMDVVDTRQAAHIPSTLPGRAFLKVHRDLDEFQSAYVGGTLRSEASAPIEVYDLWSERPAPPRPDAGGPTVLEGLVAACTRVQGLGRWAAPHVPWLPAMPGEVTLAQLAEQVPALPPTAVLLALADLPHLQAQRVVAFDLPQHQNMLVFGTSRSGKTTVLRTIAAGVIGNAGPDQVVLYGMDFAGHGLHVLEGAPQCAGVVGPDDLGRVARLVRRLTTLVEERKRAMAGAGVTSFAELAASSPEPLPRVVVLLDSYAGVVSALERLDGGRLLERVERLIPDGPGVGLHFVVTADRRSAVPSGLTSVITTRLVLRLAEKDDYALLGVDAALARNAVMGPGRGFIQGANEVQVAVLAGADPQLEQAALAKLMEQARDRWPAAVRPLGRMPSEVALASLPVPDRPLVYAVGIGDTDTEPAYVDLSEASVLVTGPPRSGRTTTLATIALAAARSADRPVLAAFLARRSPLAELGVWDVGPVDAAEPAALAHAVEEVRRLLDSGRTVLCFCDDVDSLPDQSSTALEELAKSGRDRPVRFVAAVDNRWAMRAYNGLVPELRRSKQGVLLSPEVEIDGDLVGVRLRPSVEPTGLPGRGFLVGRGVAQLVQLARGEQMSAEPASPW